MTLAFLNPSRSFDETRKAVRFTGHDGMSEIQFFVEAAALAKTGAKPDATGTTEAACLAAFDADRGSIQNTAHKAYLRGRQTFYMLTASDF